MPEPTANFIAHWDGSAWSVVPAPCLEGKKVSACSSASIDLNELTGVAAISGNDAWASGSEGNVNNMNFHIPYVLHWDGTAWSLVRTPNRGGEGSLLRGITALSADDVWAVGQTQQLNGAIMHVMHVIFRVISDSLDGLSFVTMGACRACWGFAAGLFA